MTRNILIKKTKFASDREKSTNKFGWGAEKGWWWTPSSSLSPSFSPSGPLVAPLLQRLPSSMSGDHRFHRYQRSPSLLSRDAAFIAIGHKLVPEPFDLDGAGGIWSTLDTCHLFCATQLLSILKNYWSRWSWRDLKHAWCLPSFLCHTIIVNL